MGKKQIYWNLGLIDTISNENIVTALKHSYESNQLYVRISDNILVSLVNTIFDTSTSLDYVAEYKDTSGSDHSLPPHLFQLINQAYLHMRRTGIDQSILLHGKQNNNETYHSILSHLVNLSTHKKETKLQTQVIHTQTILDAFGSPTLGKYMEIQFSGRGRMIGSKILTYLFDKRRVINQHNENYPIFYYLLYGASDEEASMLSLLKQSQYVKPVSYNDDYQEQYESLKASMKLLGLGLKKISKIMSLLSTLLHLGQLEFINSEGESAAVKDAGQLEFVADALGVDPQALENTLTYKTRIIKRDATTIILNTEQASAQRDDLVMILYSLLFNWIVEYMNTKLCATESSEINSIGIINLPATSYSHAFQKLCTNYANERLHHYIQTYIFETSMIEYKEDGLDCSFTYPPASDCVDLFDESHHGLNDIINSYSKKADYTDIDQSRALLESINKYQSQHKCFSLAKSETGAPLFVVQHFFGESEYEPHLIEANRDSIDPDFLTLFQGNGDDLLPSFNSLLTGLFDQVITESHPKQASAIIHAQPMPGRSPSVSRSKSTKQNKASAREIPPNKGKTPPLALKKLRQSLNDLFSTLDETIVWCVFSIQPTLAAGFNSKFVQNQVDTLGLVPIVERFKAVNGFSNVYTHEEFCERFSHIMDDLAIEQDRSPLSKCQAICSILNWTSEDYAIGQTKEQRKYKEQQPALRDVSDEFSISHTGSTTGSNTDLMNAHRKQPSTAAAAVAAATGLPLPKLQQGGYYSEGSVGSVEPSYPSYDTDIVSEPFTAPYGELKSMPIQEYQIIEEEKTEMSGVRKGWLMFVWIMTWWIPSFLLAFFGMKRKDIQIAWREKFTLCTIILLMSGFIIWFLVFFGKLICPVQYVFSQSELQSHSSNGNGYVAIRGEVFYLTEFAPHHWATQVISVSGIDSYAGKDVSDLLPVQVSALCQGVNGTVSEYVSLDYHFNLTDGYSKFHDFRAWTGDYRPDWYYEKIMYLRKNYKLGTMGYTKAEVHKQATQLTDVSGVPMTKTWAILNGSVYDLTFYVAGARSIQIPKNAANVNTSAADINFLSDDVVNLFQQKAGQDISQDWLSLSLDYETRRRQEVCLRNLFYAGAVDERSSARCIFSEYLLLIVTIFLCLIIVFKFLAALQFGSAPPLDAHDKFVICQVPCYTEGEEELRKTIDSVAALKYDDKRKLLFIICDGMIVGGGNDRPTPQIVLDILGADPYLDPEPLSFFSVGEGQKQHNMAKVYSGLYECRGHVVPYVVVAKVGKPSERQKPGNRGKRDSQLVLMRFLNKVHFASPMTPMELEIYHQIKNIIGVNPSFYEFILMVDADTEVMPDGLSRLVSAFVKDPKVIGLCGETKLSNEKDSWVTMIQVYEYFISHFMIKAFESLFGSVTCLPGCFCMYRIRSSTKNQPLLISNQVIGDYQVNRVDTLHKKNLLHLGEDRYLTTLILKHFPMYKTTFVPDAKCATNAPDQWSVLLSQRRRWINSTVHNLGELAFLPQLCGFCCFSMRFVVIVDLLSTLVQPAIVGYLVYLIYTLVNSSNGVPMMSILTIAGVYGLQAVIYILHRKWEHIVWMLVSIVATPVFSFFIPIYSYWHFDDFSWGNTRVVLGEKGKKLAIGADEGKFDPNTIPTMTWEKYEEGLYDPVNEVMSVGSGSQYTRSSNNTRSPKYAGSQGMRSSPSAVLSNYNNPHYPLTGGMVYPSSPLQRYD
ncbi:hypothetical protein G6F31_000872 [Rhizopus arrhizus]|nr:hypothetical protein G6F31_000872 [Rhizopus arrhizus]